MLLWHIGSIGWLLAISEGVFAILANSIIYSLVLSITFFINKKFKVVFFITIWLVFEISINTFSYSTPLLTIGNAFSNQVYLIQWYKYLNTIAGSFWFLLFSALIYKKKYFLFLLTFTIPTLLSISLLNNKIIFKKNNLKISIFNSENFIKKKTNNYISLYVDKNKEAFLNSDILLCPELMININSVNYKENFEYKIFKRLIEKKIVEKIIIGADITFYNSKHINSALILTNEKTYLKIKKKLVPYTEYMPKFLFFKIKKKSYIYNFKDDVNLIKKLKFNPIICYESFFPFYVSNNSSSSKLLIVIASEQFLKNSYFGRKQYNNILKLRAIENNSALIKCSSFSNSILINSKGNIIDTSNNEEFYTFNVTLKK